MAAPRASLLTAPPARSPHVPLRSPSHPAGNTTDTTKICGGYGDRNGDPINVNAQGIGLSLIPLADGTTAYLWHGERWLSAKDNNPTCPDECRPETGICAEPEDYIKGEGFMYIVDLKFDAQGNVEKFAPFEDAITLDIAQNFGTAHLPGPEPAAAGAAAALEREGGL